MSDIIEKISEMLVEDKYTEGLLKELKTPLKVVSGEIVDAEGNLLLRAYRASDSVLIPVYRDELVKELVRRFNKG